MHQRLCGGAAGRTFLLFVFRQLDQHAHAYFGALSHQPLADASANIFVALTRAAVAGTLVVDIAHEKIPLSSIGLPAFASKRASFAFTTASAVRTRTNSGPVVGREGATVSKALASVFWRVRSRSAFLAA